MYVRVCVFVNIFLLLVAYVTPQSGAMFCFFYVLFTVVKLFHSRGMKASYVTCSSTFHGVALGPGA